VLLARPPEYRQDTVRIMRLIGRGDEKYWVDSDGLSSPLHSYSHWMPLPEPPGTPSEGRRQVGCRLTDAEREAIGWAIAATAGVSLRAETMRGLLERTK